MSLEEDGAMSRSKYPPELRERAVRMLVEIRDQRESEWVARRAVADLLSFATPERSGSVSGGPGR